MTPQWIGMVIGMKKLVETLEQRLRADGIVDEFSLVIWHLPFGVAVLAAVIARLGNVPVDDQLVRRARGKRQFKDHEYSCMDKKGASCQRSR
jgi:hypothetical protein